MENRLNFNHPLLHNKSDYSLELLNYFIIKFKEIGELEIYPTKTMIGIGAKGKNLVYITALGKNFLHVVFPFETAYEDNLCFQKIAQVHGDKYQYNHHLRVLFKEDINEEVMNFMKLIYKN
ncbi:hypothetical protein A5893_15360 [Pedobacter psychrophilus]|uniref:DUF5655 domain-containing protein n=1 Tax=Pedobacter psychrophilus TaxID=1826909 RepID=A0A179DAU8_9SPHI|nr:hypothetical protein [Pedobacter psychrophilus]OAQ38175.1 hypothetical protein A5893_15360 [Pedobacter psychrophilus]